MGSIGITASLGSLGDILEAKRRVKEAEIMASIMQNAYYAQDGFGVGDWIANEWDQYWGNPNFWEAWGENLPDAGVSVSFYHWTGSLTYKTGLDLKGASNAFIGASLDFYSSSPGNVEVGAGLSHHMSVGVSSNTNGNNTSFNVHAGWSWPTTYVSVSGSASQSNE